MTHPLPSSPEPVPVVPVSPTVRGSRLGLIAVGIILLVATIAVPVLGLAAEVRSDDEVVVAPSERIDDDLFAAANEIRVDGTVVRDAFLAANDILIPGEVQGSLNASANTLEIAGDVAGSVRVGTGETVVSGTVGGDLWVATNTLRIEAGARVDGDVVVFGGELELLGSVGGDVQGSVGTLTVLGTVEGDIDVTVDDLEISSGAEIAGNVDYVSSDAGEVSPQAQIGGSVDRSAVSPWGSGDGTGARFFSPLVRTLWLLVAGAVIIALAPRLASAASGNVRRPWVPLVVGILALVAVPVVAVLLMVSVVGLPIGVILLGVYGVTLYLSQVVVGQRLGTLVMPRSWNDGSRGHALLAMTIGVLVISAVRFVPVPVLGPVVNALVAVIGLGAVVLLLGRLRPGPVPTRPTP